jgi:peptide/nickel transport system permease protein
MREAPDEKQIPRHVLWLGLALVGVVSILAIFSPFIAPYDPSAINVAPGLKTIYQPPSWEHWMGTDAVGRDVFSRMLHGARVSLWVGFVSVCLAMLIGVTLGLLAGYYGGLVDEGIMRLVYIILCFPSFFLILAVIAFLEPNLINIMVIIGLTSWMGIARLVRAETLTLRERDFIAAARLAGTKPRVILIRHVLPNALAPVLVSATLRHSGAILTESSLSFLGLGMQPPLPSWGNMLLEGKSALGIAWWLSAFPGFAILLTVLGYNLLGESLRDILDPRLSPRSR